MKSQVILLSLLFLLSNINCGAQANSTILKQLFYGSEDILDQVDELISLSVDAVWYASSVMENTTTTGTLNQSSSNLEYWTYSQSPADKLVLNYANGDVIQLSFNAIDGFKDGSAYDFKRSHAMDFTSVIPEKINLRIQSETFPKNGKIYWTRYISGNTVIENIPLSVNLTNTGNNNEEVENGFAFGDYYNETSGTAITSESTYTINEQYWTKIGHNSNTGIYVQSREIINNNSVNGDFGNFKFTDAHCFWIGGTSFYDEANSGIYNRVIENYNWSSSGSLYKDNQLYGSIKYDRPIVNNSNGAYIMAECNDGQNFFLYPALQPVLLTDIPTLLVSTLNLNNFPNPFIFKTTISYTLKESSQVVLSIFDQSGKEIEQVLSAYQKAGTYQIPYSGYDLSNGIYYYNLRTNKCSKTAKMLKF